MKIAILTLVAIALVLVWRLDEINSHLDETNLPLDGINLLGAFLFATLMLGLIWWKWAIEKKKDKTRRTIALRILDNLDGHRQQALSNLQRAGPNTQQRIKKAIREELRRRPADEIALMLLDGGTEMRELMGKILPQMPIEIRQDIKRAIKEEGCRREARDKAIRTIALRILDNLGGTRQYALSNLQTTEPNVQQRIKRAIREELRRQPADKIALMVLNGGAEMRELMDEMFPQMPIEIQRDIKRALEEERCRREAQEIDQLFEGSIERNTDKITRQFFSGEFQHREYVIKKIRETSAEVQHRLEQAIREKQETLLSDSQALLPGNAFVYLIRQEYFANEQFFFKIGRTNNPRRRLGELQTGNPHFLHLWAAMSFPNDADAIQMEGHLHDVCQAWQKHNEWFQGHVLEELLRAGRFAPYINIPQAPLI